MKKFGFLFVALILAITSVGQITLPVDFESSTVNYTFTGFDGGVTTVISNPFSGGINTSSKVAKMVKGAGQVWGGSFLSLTNPIDFSTNRIFKMKVYAPRVGAKVLLKVENATNSAIFYQKEVPTTTANAWEELTFDYSAINTANQYQKLVFILDNGTVGDGSPNFTFYFDDLRLITGGSTPTLTTPSLPLDFQSSSVDYTFTDFDGGVTTVISNPFSGGINTSSKVAKMVKGAGQNYGGSFILLNAPIDFSTNRTFKMKVYAPRVGAKVLLKVENATNANIKFEKEVLTTTANAWEELSFDYSAITTTNQYQKVVVILDNGTMGDGTANYTLYFDDVRLTTGGSTPTLTQMNLPVTFDDATVDYGLNGVAGAEQSTIVSDPTLASNKVAKVIKSASAQLFAFTTITAAAGLGFSTPIPFTATNTKMSVRVWSPHSGIPVRLRVEDRSNASNRYVETEATVTVANDWQTLEFNFANQVSPTTLNLTYTYNRVAIFFNFGTTGAIAGERTYYFDDVKFVTGGSTPTPVAPSLPLDFESSGVDYTFTDFDGGGTTVISNPFSGGINTSSKVAKMVKGAGQNNGGSFILMNAPIDFSTNRTFKMKVYAPRVGAKVLLKVENATNRDINFEKEVLTTTANAWEELSFDYSAITTTNQYQKIVVILDNGTMGDGTANYTLYFDDVRLTTGGSTPTPVAPSLPLDFESSGVNYTFTDFDGGVTTVISNPFSGGINTSSKVAKMVKGAGQPWGGSLIVLNAPIDFSTNRTFKMKVYAPRVGAKVLLKVENATNANIKFEKEVLTTTANAWEELSFDYSAITTTNQYQKIVVILDNGTMGDGTANYTLYFDDVRLTTGGSTPTPVAPSLPLDFESSGVNYTFTDFDGGVTTVISNPFSTGLNTSSKVAKMVKGAGQNYGGSFILLNAPIDFSTNRTFKMKVYAPRVGAKVLLKVENATNANIKFEKEVLTTTANAWEELSFDYSAITTTNQYQKIVVILDNGTMGDGTANYTLYFDDVRLTTGGSTPTPVAPSLPLDFESSGVNYTFTDFDGGVTTVISNPFSTGLNTSSKVAKMVKGAGQVWGGSSITMNAPIDFSTNRTFKMKVYAPRVGAKVLLKVENATIANIYFEKEVLTTTANAWEELSFDYSAITTTNQYQKIVVILDNGTMGDGTANYTLYFDDVRLTTGGSTPTPVAPSLPLDFESSGVNYTFTDFDGGVTTVISNPFSTGLNTSSKVAKMVKGAGQNYGGSFILLNAPIDFSTNRTFKMKVYAPRVGAKVLLKVENATNANIKFEKEVLTTTANAWEELSFDYSAITTTNQYQKIVVILDNGTMGDGTANYTLYFDDVRLTTGGSTPTPVAPSLPLDFESSGVNYTFTDFDGGVTTVISNPFSGGINTSSKVAKMVKGAGQPWGGSLIVLNAPIDFSTNRTFKMKVYAPRVGAKVLLKVENATNANIKFEKEVLTTTANAWEELSFDYSAITTTNQYQKIVVIFDNGTIGNGSANFTYYFDDVTLTTGGPTVLTQMNLPVTFDDATINYGLIGFRGAEQSKIVADPTLTSNKVARVIKSSTAQISAGTTITDSAQRGFSSRIPLDSNNTKLSVRVWSPNAGIPIRLKAVDHTDSTHAVETETIVSIANGWQVLEFDFANHINGTSPLNVNYNYDKLSIYFNFGTPGSTTLDSVYYFDDVKIVSGGGINPLPQLPLDFQQTNTNYTFADFDGGNTIVANNPDATGLNNSTKVAKMVKRAGQTWGGSYIKLKTPMDLSVKKIFKMKVYVPHAGTKVLLKVENATDASVNYEKEVSTTTVNQWEELSFDFSGINISNTYQKLVFIFDNGTMGDGTSSFTYYFDDIHLAIGSGGGTPLSQMDLPLNFDNSMVNYGLIGFGGAEQTSIVNDPVQATNKVAKVIKTAVAELNAGTTIATADGVGFVNPVPFTAQKTRMTLRVWSPDAGITVRLKLEDHSDPTKSVVAESVTNTANEWQTLEFDFAHQVEGSASLDLNNSYDKATLYFNYGISGATAGEKTYYFDDLMFVTTIPTIDQDAVLSSMSVYPNPCTQFVVLKNQYAAPLQISLFNNMGKKVKEVLSSTPTIQIDLSNLANGIYIIHVQNKLNNTSENRTIIKQ